MFLKQKLFLVSIIFFALFLRTFNISSLPALNADEAALAYNAYSLLLTGKDEHGNLWPLEFQSFNDYKPGGYVYMSLPFIKILGLTEMAIRLPNIIASVISIYLIFLLSLRIFSSVNIALLSAFFLAISPWHIHFSRGAWEVSLAGTFMLASVYALITFIDLKRIQILIFSVTMLVCSIYTYHSMRIVAPLLFSAICFINIKNFKREFFSASIVFAICIIPIMLGLLRGSSSARFSGVGITADRGPISRAEELRNHHVQGPFGRIYHNKYVEYVLRFGFNYLSHFSGEFLFVSGDQIQRNRVPDMGQLYYFEVITIIFGLIQLVRFKDIKASYLIFWLLVSPLASSLTYQSPHALRSANMIFPLSIISAFGLYYLLRRFPYPFLASSVFLVILTWHFFFYQHQYHVHMAKQFPYSSQYGFKEMINTVTQLDHQNNYSQIFITTHYDQPYILTLFFQKTDPAFFQKNHTLTPKDKYGYSTVNSFGKYVFANIDKTIYPTLKRSLVVTAAENQLDIPHLSTINLPSGKPAFYVYQFN